MNEFVEIMWDDLTPEAKERITNTIRKTDPTFDPDDMNWDVVPIADMPIPRSEEEAA